MTQLEYYYGIRSEFPGRQESPATVGAKYLNTLDALSRAHPIFANWKVIDLQAFSTMPIAEARPRIATIVKDNVKLDDHGPDPDAGYNMAATTGSNMDPGSMNISIGAGGHQQAGEITLHAGYFNLAPDASIVTYPIFKAAFLAIGAGWPATWACAFAFSMGYDKRPLVPGMPLFPGSRYHIPWLAYLSGPLIDGLTLPPEILAERTPDGGLLMIAAEERLEPRNPEHVRRARILADVMIARAGTRSW
jgi:hypothetical protein